ncbi:c-type cytochrome [Thiohalomonas denitrificans]|uniref:Cytochrome subunit of sulfide dehydrogenase n=1 Tax=Thiohalomonas denitrificans TaxID=415747 RepID=A0A1G5QK63_9GAMM|nr:c-type cytochrome [Thiohalomonas denitrificans]SCZ62245.1 cytochrome subunit of sulfide dehydrogenase [Thiohalomonas denitrificans]
MSLKRTLKMVLAGGIALSTTTLASGPSPEMLAQTCAACHGTNGSSIAFTPSIAGADPEYFVDSMQAFKNGDRNVTVMDRIAKGYSDDQIQKMAEFFAKQPARPMEQEYSPVKAKLGATLHEDYCEKCHEDGGLDSETSAVLAGQSMLYLNYSMADFKEGHRETPKKMARRVKSLLKEHGPDGLDTILHYYASQK